MAKYCLIFGVRYTEKVLKETMRKYPITTGFVRLLEEPLNVCPLNSSALEFMAIMYQIEIILKGCQPKHTLPLLLYQV